MFNDYTALYSSSIIWNKNPCSPLKFNPRFGRTCRFHRQGWKISFTSRLSTDTRRYIPGNITLHNHRWENLKFYFRCIILRLPFMYWFWSWCPFRRVPLLKEWDSRHVSMDNHTDSCWWGIWFSAWHQRGVVTWLRRKSQRSCGTRVFTLHRSLSALNYPY
jgi:hypothetical protein